MGKYEFSRAVALQQTLSLFRQGLSPQEIAERRALTTATVFGHFAELIGRNLVQVTAVVSVQRVQKIRAAIQDVGVSALKPIKERLPEDYSYDEIRCVVSDAIRRTASTASGVSKSSELAGIRRACDGGNIG